MIDPKGQDRLGFVHERQARCILCGSPADVVPVKVEGLKRILLKPICDNCIGGFVVVKDNWPPTLPEEG